MGDPFIQASGRRELSLLHLWLVSLAPLTPMSASQGIVWADAMGRLSASEEGHYGFWRVDQSPSPAGVTSPPLVRALPRPHAHTECSWLALPPSFFSAPAPITDGPHHRHNRIVHRAERLSDAPVSSSPPDSFTPHAGIPRPRRSPQHSPPTSLVTYGYP